MIALHIVLGVAVLAANLLAGAWGAWHWWRAEPSRAFWPMLRIGQALVVVQAIQGGILLLLGREPPSLHLLYGLLPLGVAFIAEQLRLAAADAVLSARDLDSAEDVGHLPAAEQRSVVLAIVRRETGVMAASALVTVVLVVRAAGWL